MRKSACKKNGILIVSLWVLTTMTSCQHGTSYEKGVVNLSEIEDLYSQRDYDFLSHLRPICFLGKNIFDFKSIPADRLPPYYDYRSKYLDTIDCMVRNKHGIFSASIHTPSDKIAYISFVVINSEERHHYELRLFDAAQKTSEVLITRKGRIYSPSWSPDGKNLVFWVGQEEVAAYPEKSPMQLCMIQDMSRSHECKTLRSILLGRKVDDAITWGPQGESLYFLSKEGIISEYHFKTDEIESKDIAAAKLLAATPEAFIIARTKPWRVLRVSKIDQTERELCRFHTISNILCSVLLPDSKMISILVKSMSGPLDFKHYTLFMDIESGKILGKIDLPVVGYLKQNDN